LEEPEELAALRSVVRVPNQTDDDKHPYGEHDDTAPEVTGTGIGLVGSAACLGQNQDYRKKYDSKKDNHDATVIHPAFSVVPPN